MDGRFALVRYGSSNSGQMVSHLLVQHVVVGVSDERPVVRVEELLTRHLDKCELKPAKQEV